MTAENCKFKVVIFLGRKTSAVVTFLLDELLESESIYLHYVTHVLTSSAKSHPLGKCQNYTSAEYEECCINNASGKPTR
jgi:hypothetical protein